MTTEEKLNLIKQVGEEIITENDLIKLLRSGEEIIAYDGFEPSGQIHIAQGLLRTININKMIRAGVKFKMLIADWHAMANNKLDGDLEKIQTVGNYFIEVWKACGMNVENVDFVWASDLVKNSDYWKLVLQIARTNGLRRFIRTAEIMGRAESLDLTAAQIIYPCMQTADIFWLGAKITQLGMDQRKVNMLAREVGPLLDPPIGGYKPIVVSHHMLLGLTKSQITNPKSQTNSNNQNLNVQKKIDISERVSTSGDPQSAALSEDWGKRETGPAADLKLQETIALKMSKSNPDSAIFMTDSSEDIKRKINKAYCPEGIVENNPILEYCKYIIFESFDNLKIDSLTIQRPEKFGGNITIGSYDELEKMFVEKKLHPMDLKNEVAIKINELLTPVRKHFIENTTAGQLLSSVKKFQITR